MAAAEEEAAGLKDVGPDGSGAGAEEAERLAGAGVAVAQAILSGDPRLAEVLEANLVELPAAQFLWLVDEDDGEGQRVCRALAARHPGCRIEILVLPPPAEGHNPKVHKLELARGAIREPVVLVLDDDTRMPAATLASLVRALGPGEEPRPDPERGPVHRPLPGNSTASPAGRPETEGRKRRYRVFDDRTFVAIRSDGAPER